MQIQVVGVVVSVGGSGSDLECGLPVFHLWSPEANFATVDTILVTRA